MVVEKRVVFVQVLMYIMFIMWSLSLLLSIFYKDDWIYYVRFGVFFALLGIIFLVFKRGDKTLIEIDENSIGNNKKILYTFMIGYLAQILLVNFLGDYSTIIYIATTIVMVGVSTVGLIINAKILLDNKKDK